MKTLETLYTFSDNKLTRVVTIVETKAIGVPTTSALRKYANGKKAH